MVALCNAIQNSTAWINENNNAQPLLQQLATLWNVSTSEVPWWVGLWDNFEARDAHGLSLPPGITPEIVDEVVDVGKCSYDCTKDLLIISIMGINCIISKQGSWTVGNWTFYSRCCSTNPRQYERC
jgi:hypothetical protein